MACDHDGSQSEALDVCVIATDKPDTIDHSIQTVVSETLIKSGPFTGQRSNRVKLGPFFRPECVKALLPSLVGFPDTPSHPPFIYSSDEFKCHWFKDTSKPITGWTSSHDSLDWFNRLSSRHQKWRNQRIYEFLKLSTYRVLPFDGVVSGSLLCCWNPCLNAFITGRGPMTVTLEDIAFITGLSPAGLELPYHKHVPGALDTTTQVLFRKGSDNKALPNLPFSYFISEYTTNSEKEVTREEEVLFINFAICKLLMGPSVNVNRTFLPLAANIEASSKDGPLALAPFLLAQFYRCMFKLRTSSSLVHKGGPVWLLSFWGFLYFPSLVTIKSREEVDKNIKEGICISPSSACCYGEMAIILMSSPSRKNFKEVLRQLVDPKPSARLNKTNWHPCSAKNEIDGSLDEYTSWAQIACPVWLLETCSIHYRTEDCAHWQSIFAARDLLYVGSRSIGVEVYNPNMVARQFGMIQGCPVPFFQTQNLPWGGRMEFLIGGLKKNPQDELDRKYTFEKSLSYRETLKITKFIVQPWYCSEEVDDGFHIWWKNFMKRHRKALSFISNQEVVSRPLRKRQALLDIPDITPNIAETHVETEAEETLPEMGDMVLVQGDGPPISSQRKKMRITASSPQPLKQQDDHVMRNKVTNNEEEEDEEEEEEDDDDGIPLCRLVKHRKSIQTIYNNSTPSSSGVGGLRKDSVETFEDSNTSKSNSMDTPLMDTSHRGSISLGNLVRQQEDAEAPNSVKSYGEFSARIERILKTLSHSPSSKMSLLEASKASLLNNLDRLVNEPKCFDDFTSLTRLAKEFTQLAPPSFQSTMDHLNKSIISIQELSIKLKDQEPTISSSLEKKPQLTSLIIGLKHDMEKKTEKVQLLQETHVNLCTKINTLEAELTQLRGERAEIEEHLERVDNELSSVSGKLDASFTNLEDEAASLSRAECLRKEWDEDMIVFKSAIRGIIEQLRSL